jgi:hypothetical protein
MEKVPQYEDKMGDTGKRWMERSAINRFELPILIPTFLKEILDLPENLFYSILGMKDYSISCYFSTAI